MKEFDIEVISSALEGTIDDTVAKMTRVHGPYWNSRIDVSKTVLTITAAVLVGTISFSSSLLGPGKSVLQFQGALFVSWVLFMLSGFAALYAFWHIYKLNSRHVLLSNTKPNIEKKLNEVGSKQTEGELKLELDKILIKMVNESLSPLAESDQHSHYALACQLVTFALGLLAFLVFGVAQVV